MSGIKKEVSVENLNLNDEATSNDNETFTAAQQIQTGPFNLKPTLKTKLNSSVKAATSNEPSTSHSNEVNAKRTRKTKQSICFEPESDEDSSSFD